MKKYANWIAGTVGVALGVAGVFVYLAMTGQTIAPK